MWKVYNMQLKRLNRLLTSQCSAVSTFPPEMDNFPGFGYKLGIDVNWQ